MNEFRILVGEARRPHFASTVPARPGAAMTVNWPGRPLTAHDRSALPKNPSLLPKTDRFCPLRNARLLPKRYIKMGQSIVTGSN
jgi:hypothetical protein